jgi:hypothetical protein
VFKPSTARGHHHGAPPCPLQPPQSQRSSRSRLGARISPLGTKMRHAGFPRHEATPQGGRQGPMSSHTGYRHRRGSETFGATIACLTAPFGALGPSPSVRSSRNARWGHHHGALPRPAKRATIPVFKPKPAGHKDQPLGHQDETRWLHRHAESEVASKRRRIDASRRRVRRLSDYDRLERGVHLASVRVWATSLGRQR